MRGRYNEPVIGSSDTIVTSRNSRIHMFTVDGKMDSIPSTNCEGRWQEASSETVSNFTAVGYFFTCKLNSTSGVPVEVIHAGCGDSRVGAWMSKGSIEPYRDLQEVRNGSIPCNGVLSPVIGYGIRECLWYQGEIDIDTLDLYTQLFLALVSDRRRQWKVGKSPFYYIQIVPFSYNKGREKGENFASLREAQMKCLGYIPSLGMITLTDVDDVRTIRPTEKETVKNRSAYLILGRTYGKRGFLITGPLYRSTKVEGSKVVLSFDEIDKGSTTFHRSFMGFEIAGEDRILHPADACLGEGAQTVAASNLEVKHPVTARYVSRDYVEGCLFNMSGLSASSFRTDNW